MSLNLNIDVTQSGVDKIEKALTAMIDKIAAEGGDVSMFDVKKISADIAEIKDEYGDLSKYLEKTFGENVEIVPDVGGGKASINELAESYVKLQREIQELLSVQKFALAQMRVNGKENSAEFIELQKQIKETESALNELNSASEKGGESFADSYFKFEALSQLGDQLANAKSKADEYRESIASLGARTGTSGEELQGLVDISTDLYLNPDTIKAFDDLGSSIAAVAQSRKILGDEFSQSDIKQLAIDGSAFGKVWEEDVNNVIAVTGNFAKNFETSATEAFDLVALAKQRSTSSDDDVLDTFREYPKLLDEAGLSAEEFTGIMIRGGEDAAFQTDKIADAIKETQIRVQAGDVTKAFEGISDIPKGLQDEISGLLSQAESGEISIFDFIQKSAEKIDGADISKSLKTQMQVAISGTPAEELGVELYGKLFGAPIDEEQIKAQARLAGKGIRDTVSEGNVFDSLARQAELAFVDIASFIGPVLGPLGSMTTLVGDIAPGLTLLDDKFGIFGKAKDLISGLIPKITAYIGLQTAQATAAGAQATATGGATVAQGLLNAVMNANPILLLLTGVGLLVGAYAIFSDSTKSIAEATKDADAALQDFNDNRLNADAVKKDSDELRKLADEHERLKGKTDPESQQRFIAVTEELAARVPSATDTVEALGDGAEGAAPKLAITTEEVRSLADENQRLAEQGEKDSLENLSDQAVALADSLREAKEKQAELREERDRLNQLSKEGLGDVAGLGISGDLFDSVNDQVKDIRSELSGVSKEVDTGNASMKKIVKSFIEAGASTEEIAEKTSLSTKEVEQLKGELQRAESAGKKTAGEATKIKSELDKAQEKAALLGKKFDENKKKISDLASTSISALAQSLIDLEAAKTAGDNARTAAAQAAVDQNVQAARSAVRSEKNIASIFARAEILAGRKTAEKKDRIDAAIEVVKVLEDLNDKLTLERLSNLDKELEGLQQQEEGERESIKAKLKSLQEYQKDRSKILLNPQALRDLEGGGKAEVAVEAKYLLLRQKAQREFYKGLLEERSADYAESRQRELTELSLTISAISDTTREGLQSIGEARLSELDVQEAIELNGLISSNDKYIAAYTELMGIKSTLRDADSQEEIATITAIISEQEKQLEILADNIAASDINAVLVQKGFAQKRLDVTRETVDKIIQLELAGITEAQNKSLDLLRANVASYQGVIDGVARTIEAVADTAVDEFISTETARLDGLKEQGLIAEEKYQSQLSAVQQKGEEDRAALKSKVIGLRLESERQAALAELEINRKATEDKLAEARKLGDVELEGQLTGDLDKLNEEISQKSNVIVGVSTELQSSLGDIYGNLFSGDTDKIKDPFRKSLAVIGGALQKFASAKIVEILLSSIPLGTGFLGFLGALAIKPLIEQAMNAILSPILDGLLSFPTSGQVIVTRPTLFVAGDTPGDPTELVLNTEHLNKIMARQSRLTASQFLSGFTDVVGAIENLEGRFYVLQSDVGRAAKKHIRSSRPLTGFY